MADYPDSPHFGVPFSFTSTGAAVTEEDSVAEVYGCIQVIAACETGERLDLPDFGIPSTLFANAPIDTAGIQNALARWEPRAGTEIREYPDPTDPSGSSRHIHIDVLVSE